MKKHTSIPESHTSLDPAGSIQFDMDDQGELQQDALQVDDLKQDSSEIYDIEADIPQACQHSSMIPHNDPFQNELGLLIYFILFYLPWD